MPAHATTKKDLRSPRSRQNLPKNEREEKEERAAREETGRTLPLTLPVPLREEKLFAKKATPTAFISCSVLEKQQLRPNNEE